MPSGDRSKDSKPKCIACELFPWIVAIGLSTGYAAGIGARAQKYPTLKSAAAGTSVFITGIYFVFPSASRAALNLKRKIMGEGW
jgi:hypothetical protein